MIISTLGLNWGWHLLAGIYGKAYGADAYYDWMMSINFAGSLHKPRPVTPVFHTKLEVSRGLYTLARHWETEVANAFKVQGPPDGFRYSQWDLHQAAETGRYIPRLDFSESSPAAQVLYI